MGHSAVSAGNWDVVKSGTGFFPVYRGLSRRPVADRVADEDVPRHADRHVAQRSFHISCIKRGLMGK